LCLLRPFLDPDLRHPLRDRCVKFIWQGDAFPISIS
jgi:hypothetical protein